ncbi:MAG: glycosyltransferase family 39 protein [Candidatus Altiarchaeota archaeon]
MRSEKWGNIFNKEAALLVIILIMACCFRLYYFNGIGMHDDFLYLMLVRKWIDGHNSLDGILNHYAGLRLFVYYPIVFLFQIFGASYRLAFLPTFTLSMLEVVLAYALCSTAFNDKRAGLFAALLMSVFPLDAFVSTTIRGDTEIGFYAMLSVFLFTVSKKYMGGTYRTLLLLSGFAAGIVYNVKKLGLMVMAAYMIISVIHSAYSRRIRWKYMYVLAGFLLFVAAEGAYLKLETGNILQRYDVGLLLQTHIYENPNVVDPTQDPWYVPCLLLDIQNGYCDRVVNSLHWTQKYTRTGGFYLMVFLSMIYLSHKRDRRYYFMMLWVAVILAYFAFGTMSPQKYLPLHKEPRYFTIITGPSMIILAGGLSRFTENRGHGRARWMIVAVIITALVYQSAGIMGDYHRTYTRYNQFNREIYEFVRENEKANVWTEAFIEQDLELKSGYSRRSGVKNFKGDPSKGFIGDLSYYDCRRDNRGAYIILTRESDFNDIRAKYAGGWRDCIIANIFNPNRMRLVRRTYSEDKKTWLSIYNIL